MEPLLSPKYESLGNKIIALITIAIFGTITILAYVTPPEIELPFNVHILPAFHASMNACVAVLLIASFAAIKAKKWILHRNLNMTALLCSSLFLLSYVAFHLLTESTRFGDANGDGVVSLMEKDAVGNTRFFYLIILLTHILLSAISFPFILLSFFKAFVGNFKSHRKIAKWVMPVWLYVAITGVVVYFMISPYYQ